MDNIEKIMSILIDFNSKKISIDESIDKINIIINDSYDIGKLMQMNSDISICEVELISSSSNDVKYNISRIIRKIENNISGLVNE